MGSSLSKITSENLFLLQVISDVCNLTFKGTRIVIPPKHL